MGGMESDENIVNLIPPRVEIEYKPPMYRSKFSGKVDPNTMEMGVSKLSLQVVG